MQQEESDEENVGLYATGQMVNDPVYGQMWYNNFLSNGFKLKPGHNLKLFLVEMKSATRKDKAEHIVEPLEVSCTSFVTIRYV